MTDSRTLSARVLLSGCVLLGSLAAAVPVVAVPTPGVLHATRTRGTAPLAVLFDAPEAGDPDFPRAFHSLRYVWSFGDASVHASQSWPVSGMPRGHAVGPVAGHLFTDPGSYEVTPTVTNPRGESASSRIRIAVDDPDTEASGIGRLRTWCFANEGVPGGPTFSGCPHQDASRQVVTDDFGEALGGRYCHAVRGRRQCLFRRGDSFWLREMVLLGKRGGLIAAFGEGPRPLVRTPEGRRRWIQARDDWRLTQLDFRGRGGVPIGRPGNSSFAVSQFTVFDVSAAGYAACLEFNNIGGESAEFHSQLAVVDYRCGQLSPEQARGWTCFDRSHHSMFMGLEIRGGGAHSEGVFRSVHMNTSVLQHSRLSGNTSHGVLSIRSCGQDNGKGCTEGGVPNQRIVVSDNRFQEGHGITLRTCTHDECDLSGSRGNASRDLLFERNLFSIAGPGIETRRFIWFQSSDLSFRNNVLDLSNLRLGALRRTRISSVTEGPSDAGRASFDRVEVYNNTVYAGGAPPHGGFVLCDAATGSGHLCANNLIFAPAAAGKLASVGDWQAAHNLRDGSEYRCTDACAARGLFAVPVPAAFEDFRLAGAGRIAAGVDPVRGGRLEAGFGSARLDAFLGCRPARGAIAVGAHEPGASPCVPGLPEERPAR